MVLTSRRRKARRSSPIRRPARRDAVISLVFLMLPALLALLLEWRYHDLGIGAVSILVSAALGLPLLWLTWAIYRESGRPAETVGKVNLTEIADKLAVVIKAQWESESVVRQLNDPYPLSVSWVAADTSLAEEWDLLVALATTGAGWPTSSSAGVVWADRPDDLAGSGNDLSRVLDRVPTRRLVLLGEPGSGKSMLMVRLMLDLLSNRAEGGPVPVLASLASWDPGRESLHEWLTGLLVTDYPGIVSAHGPAGSPSIVGEMLSERLIVLLLDALDEMPEKSRPLAISRINNSLLPGETVIVTCRSKEYRELASSRPEVRAAIRGAAAIQLCALEPGQVGEYLLKDARAPELAARWATVLDPQGTSGPAGQALATPLMVGLARFVYNPRSGERCSHLRDPAELCEFSDKASVEAHLFDSFVQVAYRREPDERPTSWDPSRAEVWLMFLASHTEYTLGSTDFGWWTLPHDNPSLPAVVRAGWAGLLMGVYASVVLGGIPDIIISLIVALMVGLISATISWLFWGDRAPPGPSADPAWKLRIRPIRFVTWLTAGIVTGCATWLAFGYMPAFWLGIAAGLLAGFLVALTGVSEDKLAAASPGALLARDRHAAVIAFISALMMPAAVTMFAAVLIVELVPRHLGIAPIIWTAAVVLFYAAGIAMRFAAGKTAWPRYFLARSLLAIEGDLPWSLMQFLDDAHGRGVLRQVGSVYQFRHVGLQRRLAYRQYQAPAELRSSSSSLDIAG